MYYSSLSKKTSCEKDLEGVGLVTVLNYLTI
jgi:hypothetical protein